jgi:hypothetical protein
MERHFSEETSGRRGLGAARVRTVPSGGAAALEPEGGAA